MLFTATRPQNAWLALLLTACTLCCQARIWHVTQNGNDHADGLSWSNALASPQVALDCAMSGDQLWIAQGIYFPSIDNTQILPSGAFRLRDGIDLFGGFSGTETSPEERERHDRDGNGIVELWEFTHETILVLPEQVQGPVLTTGMTPFECPTRLDGVTVAGGHNSGAATVDYPGLGGGAYLNGTVFVSQCEFSDNQAMKGGAVYAIGAVRLEGNNFVDNTALQAGGAVWLGGPSSTVVNCVFLQNGAVTECTNGGGAVWLTDQAEASFSSFARNASVGPGTGIHAEAQSVLRNCVIWQGTGHGQDCQADATCQVIACAVMDGGTPYLADPRNFGLCANNAGASGLQVNDNTPALHYPCFVTPDEDNYSLAAGSFLINRGEFYDGIPLTDVCGTPRVSCGLPDIGAYESDFYGNLVITAELASELYYGLTAELVVTLDGEADWEVTSANPAIASLDLAFVYGEHAGETELIIEYTPKEEFWADGEFHLPVTVLPRPLTVAADILEWHSARQPRPALTWKVIAGQLVAGDNITGELSCAVNDFPTILPAWLPITQGNLQIIPENNAECYNLTFVDGVIQCLENRADILLEDCQTTYQGVPIALEATTIPNGLALEYRYQDANTGEILAHPPVLPGEYLVTATVMDADYSGEATARLEIAKAPLQCRADDIYRAYRKPNPELTCTFTGFVNGETAEVLDTQPVLVTSATLDSPIIPEGYPIGITIGEDDCYDITALPGTLYVTLKQPNINEVAATVMTYGEPLELVWLMAYSTDPDTDEYVPGEFIWEDAEYVLDAGLWICPWTFVPDDLDTYGCVKGKSEVTIMRRPIRVEASDRRKPYGDPEVRLPLTVTLGSLARGDRFQGDMERIAGEQPGTYPIKQGMLTIVRGERDVLHNYELIFVEGTYTIELRQVTIAADSLEKLGGQPDPVFTWQIIVGSLLDDADLAGTLVREPGETAGEYRITQGTLMLPETYQLTFIEGILTIRQTLLEIATDDQGNPQFTVDPITYGEPLDGATQIHGTVVSTTTGEEVPGTFTWDHDGEYPETGEQEQGWIFTPEDQDQFIPLTGEVTITVLPATLTVTADDATRAYGTPNPQFTCEIEGFVLGEDAGVLTALPTVSSEATASSTPGDYAITASGAAADNYVFSYVDGTLTVTKGHIAGGAGDQVVTVGTLTYGQTLGELPLEGAFTDDAGNAVPGTLAWDEPDSHPTCATTEAGWSFVPDKPECHEGTAGTAAIVVNPAMLTVTADDATRAYGTPNPQFTCEIKGFVLGEDTGVLTALPTVSSEATASSTPGDYAIMASGAAADNYVFQYVDGTLTITKGHIAGGLGDQVVATGTLTYGQTLGELPLEGAFTDEAGNAVPGTLAWDEPDSHPTCATTEASWHFTPDDQECHEGTAGTAAIAVLPASLTVTANDATRAYGTPNPQFTCEIKGFVLREDAGVLAALPTVSCEATASSAPGDYAIMASGAAADNYVFQYVDGTLTITRRMLVIQADNLSKRFGAVDPEFTFQFIGDNPLFDDSFTGNLMRESGEAVGQYAIHQGTLSISDSYTIVFHPGIFTIQPSELEIAQDESGRKMLSVDQLTYGDPLDGSEQIHGTVISNATSEEVPGAFAWEKDGEFLPVGTHELTWIFQPDDQDKYTPITGIALLTVNPATLLVKALDATREYAQENPPFELEITGFVLNEDEAVLQTMPSASTTADRYSYPGEYPIEVTGGKADNYVFFYQDGTLEITAAQSSHISAEHWAYMNYGQKLSEANISTRFFDALQQEITGTIEWVEPDSYPDCATTSAEILFTPDDLVRYTPFFTATTITVHRVNLGLACRAAAREYNQENPELTYDLFNFVLDDTPETALTIMPKVYTSATLDSPPGYYDIWASGGEAPNYNIRGSVAILTIIKAGVEPGLGGIIASPLTYGQPLSESILSGVMIQLDKIPLTEVPGTFAWLDPTIIPNCGTTACQWVFTPDRSDCYTQYYGVSNVTVQPANLTVNVANVTRLYGEENPAFRYEISGFVGEDSSNVLSELPTTECDATVTSAVGEYAIRCAEVTDGNYQLVCQEGHLTVKPRTLAITADSLSKSCLEEDPELTYVTAGDGLVNGDTLTGHLERDPGEEAGQYIIRQGTLAASENYDTMFTAGTLTIERLTPTLVEAHGSEFIYGQRIGESDYGATFANPLTGEVIPGTLTIEAPDFRPWAGTARHRIYFHPDEPEKYTDAEAVVRFIIRQRPLRVQILPPIIIFGQKLTELDYTIANGDILPGDDLTLFFPILEDGTDELDAGEYPILATPMSADRNIAHSYQVVMEETCLTVLPAAIEVVADDVVAEVDGELPALTFTVRDGDHENADAFAKTLSGSLECDADLSHPGRYPIIQGTLSTDCNHTLHFQNGILTVRKCHQEVLFSPADHAAAPAHGTIVVRVGDSRQGISLREFTADETLFGDLDGALQALQTDGILWLAPGEHDLPNGRLRLSRNLELRCNQAEETAATVRLHGTLTASPSLDRLTLANLEILGDAMVLNLQAAAPELEFTALECVFAADDAVRLASFRRASFDTVDFLFRNCGLRLLPAAAAGTLELRDLTFTHEDDTQEYWHIYCENAQLAGNDNTSIKLENCVFDGIFLTVEAPELPLIKEHILDGEDDECTAGVTFQP